MKYLFILTIASFFSNSVYSQEILDWSAHTSFRSVIGLEQDIERRIWLSTEGGIAVYEDSVLVKALTIVDGLSRLSGTSIEYDPGTNSIFVGYVDGLIDMINVETFEIKQIEDINRNTVFSSKSVNKILANEQMLLVGTDFGIIEYDISSLFVRNSYLKLGNFDTGTIINDMVVIDNELFVATEQGIAFSELDGNFAESDWTNYDENSGLGGESIQVLGYFNGKIVASSTMQNYMLENGIWSDNNIFNGNIIIDYETQPPIAIALSERNVFTEQGSIISSQFIPNKIATSLNNSTDDDIIFGTLNNGIGFANESNTRLSFIIPEGPYQNFFQGLGFDNGTLISSSSQKSSGIGGIDKGKGYYIYDGDIWTNINAYTDNELNTKGYQQAFTSLVTEQYYYFGSWGRGISRFDKETKEVVVFDETNTTIRGWSGAALDYPVMIGLEEDSNGDIWTVSRFSEIPLYRQSSGDEDWQAFGENTAISSADLYEGLFIDSFDLKWIPLQNQSASGTGLLILDTNNPSDESDDVGVKLQTGSNNGNLPDNKVKAIVQDKNGEVWIGTERGIAKFIFPELIVDGSVQERTAQWLVNEDTSAVSRFLLRDINVSSMAVNAANEKWIGSTNQGIWVVNAEGSKIIKRFTKENSPLFSDNIISIAINDVTGEVFIATDVGLISYQDIPKKPVSEMNNLKVFPNPFNYEKNETIFIEGLSDASTIKILGVDGTVIDRFETKGGRVSWDAKDHNGSELGSGVYFIIAVDIEGNSKGVGKIIIIR